MLDSKYMTIITTGPSEQEVKDRIKTMRAASDKITASKETARAYLIKNGFMTKGGKLTKRYGG